MPINPKYLAPFEAGKFYHVYNRAHSNLQLFSAAQDYNRFLLKTEEYLIKYVEFYSYTLIPNHFHFFMRVNEIDESIYKSNFNNVDAFLSEIFRRLFISHTGWFNIKYERHGGLFSTPCRCIEVTSEEYLLRMMYYIHWNHVHHGLSNKLEDYSYSSYHDYLYHQPSMVNKEKVLQWFGGKENFFRQHQLQSANYLDFKFSIE